MPQLINLSNKEDVTLKFRVRKPIKDVNLIVESNGEVLSKSVKPVLIPSEMAMVKLPYDKIKDLKDDVIVRLEARN